MINSAVLVSCDTKPQPSEQSIHEEGSQQTDETAHTLNYIFKDDVDEQEQSTVIAEAEMAMAQIDEMLGMELAESFDCIFDGSYKNKNGESRSYADYISKTVHCVAYDDFAHEYIHMLLSLSPERVYDPIELLEEGTAMYFSLLWQEKYGDSYEYLSDKDFARMQSPKEDAEVCKILVDSGLELTEKNYYNAVVGFFTHSVGFDKQLDAQFENYYVGSVLVEYLVTQRGGTQKFANVYFDSVRADEVYGKDIDALKHLALVWNNNRFVYS